MDTTDLHNLTVDVAGRVATLTLQRPAQRNALDATLLRELATVARRLDDADDVRVVVVRGAGRAFCAGADLSLLRGIADADDPRETADLGRVMADAIGGIQAVTIAAIHGWCVGGGLVLAAACDLRVASTDARFSIPEVDLGIPLAWGGIPRLVREIGPARTKELVLTCREFSPQEARDIGFLNSVVRPDDLDDEVGELAASLAAKPGAAVRPTTTHVDAVTAQMVGLGNSWSDADALLTAVRDPESAAARDAYLRDRGH